MSAVTNKVFAVSSIAYSWMSFHCAGLG